MIYQISRNISDAICMRQWIVSPIVYVMIGHVLGTVSLHWRNPYPCGLCYYRKTSSISRTKFQNLNVSCILMQLSSLNSLKSGVKLIMKMLLEQRRQAMLQLHLSYQHFYCLLRCHLYYRLHGSLDAFGQQGLNRNELDMDYWHTCPRPA